jgi:predicted acetyltransferase
VPELITPTTRLRESWLQARDEWGVGVHQDGAGFAPGQDVEPPGAFDAFVQGLLAQADTAVAPPPGRVHASYWWVVEGDMYLGAITLRYSLNDFLLNAGGHIGYGIRPSARRRGLAGWALGQVLEQARGQGLERVLVTCADTNVASARTIERRGGVLEDVRDTELGRTRRYWIELDGGAPLAPTTR